MKNLKPYIYLENFIDIIDVKCITKGRDILEETLTILLSTKDSVYLYSCLNQKLTCLCRISDLISLSSDVCITCITYDDISDSLITCLSDGNIITQHFDHDSLGEVNYLACVPGGIECVQWSPDRENVLISNSTSFYILSATYYEILQQINLFSENIGENVSINVGWGKKETQFHGSEGKDAAKKSKIIVDSSLINDDHKCHISWGGDSSVFSVSYWDHSESLRYIKTFDKSGALLSINEDIPGLAGPICWRPYGDLLAFSERTPDHYVIGFLEKNGLKHGDFSLPSDLKIKQVSWNADSSILGLVCESVVDRSHFLLLWVTGNYRWYLKQKIALPSSVAHFLWDENRGKRLFCMCQNGMFFTVEFISFVDANKEWCAGNDNGYVAVIDNDEILLTCFKEAVIPPPMCRWQLKCPEAVSLVLFPSWSNQDKSNTVLCSITHNSKLILWERKEMSITIADTLSLSTLERSGGFVPNCLNPWLWLSPDTFITTFNTNTRKTLVLLLQIENGHLIEKCSCETSFFPLSLHGYKGQCFLQSLTGEIFKVNFNANSLEKLLALPEPCCTIEINETGIISLSEKHRLYRDGDQIGSQVTSFLLHHSFLLATTSLHTLLVYNNTSHQCKEISCRKLENGSRLVVATDTTVIFQLPRGNLEAIQPRALIVETVGRLLDSKMFRHAVSLLCRQRIDLNLIVDHNPHYFLSSVAEFVQEVDPKWITLLVTDLKSDSVTSGIYSDFYPKDHISLGSDNKVKDVCTSLYNEMMKNEESFTLPILGCLVKMDRMSDALNLASSDESLQHLLFLVDVDKLYNEALLSYNLQAALRIAGKSQKDPKEYLPYLNNLRSMEPSYMRYFIDKSLNRPESALRNIYQCQGEDKFSECIQLIKDYCLYSTALQLFTNDTPKYKMIAELYGDYLMSLKKFTEAGIMYKRSGTPRKAVDPFLKLGDWRECISLSNECGYSDKEKESLIQTLKGVLKGTQKYQDAASLCLNVMNDVNLSVEMLAQGKHWKEAIYIAKSKGYDALIETVIKKILLEHAELLREEVEKNIELISKHSERLKIVREGKHKSELASLAEPWEVPQSDTSSVSSLRTSSSSVSRSSKNTRKANRKMWSLKEGNPREEQALVSALSSSLEIAEKMSVEVQGNCLSLLEVNCDNIACNLQEKYKQLVQLCNKSKSTIWPKDPDVDEISLMDERLKIPPQTCILSDWELHILK